MGQSLTHVSINNTSLFTFFYFDITYVSGANKYETLGITNTDKGKETYDHKTVTLIMIFISHQREL